ncbi:NAD-dependent epimerase/dehydratase family protein [Cryobacterium sp. TMT2-14]|nr:NAD-dependent epimerase/dehydratase family protein [Cryobacterium sp. TMT2-14]
MSRCLVIGANGFIGSHVVDALASKGHEVTAFDRFSSGEVSFSSPNVTRHAGDFLNHADLADALANQKFVFHFLSTTTPAIADNEPTLDIRTNISQSVDLFQLCANAAIEKVYFASTGGAIYGDQGHSRYRETDLALPVSPYGIAKLTIEHYLRYFRAKHGLDSVSLRISNPYGTRQHPRKTQGLIPIALRQIALGEPVLRFGSGTMIRDFIYVEDVARVIAEMTGIETEHDVYNLGSGRGNTVNNVLETIRKVTKQDFDIRQVPIPPTFVNKVVLDTTRISAEFSVRSLISLEHGIEKTWAGQLESAFR